MRDHGQPPASWPYIGLAMTSLFWAGNAVVARGTADNIGPFSLSFWRWTVCLCLISPFAINAVWRHFPDIKKNFPQLLILAMLSVTSFNSLLYLAAQNTSALNITLVNSAMPVVVIALSVPFLGHRIKVNQIIGVLIALSGVLTIISQGSIRTLLGIHFNEGDLVMTLAMLSWSTYSVLLRKWPQNIPSFSLFCILLVLGWPFLVPFYGMELFFRGGFDLNRTMLLTIGYVAIFPSMFAYSLWAYGVKHTAPSTAALFSYLTPLFAAIMGMIFLNEQPMFFHVAGALLILTGLILSNWRALFGNRGS